MREQRCATGYDEVDGDTGHDTRTALTVQLRYVTSVVTGGGWHSPWEGKCALSAAALRQSHDMHPHDAPPAAHICYRCDIHPAVASSPVFNHTHLSHPHHGLPQRSLFLWALVDAYRVRLLVHISADGSKERHPTSSLYTIRHHTPFKWSPIHSAAHLQTLLP